MIFIKLPLSLIYIIYTTALGLLVIAALPKPEIRRLSFPGIIYGGVMDFFIIIIVTHLLGLGGYKNYHPFGFMGVPLFPLLAWTFFYILYLYHLPERKSWRIVYTVTSAGYCTLFSNVLQNLGIFQWNLSRLFIPFLLYLTWSFIVTFTYCKYLDL